MSFFIETFNFAEREQTMKNIKEKISRRNFVKFGGATIAGSTLKLSSADNILPGQDKEDKKNNIRKYSMLGRTGFKVSDIGMGTTRLKESSVVRYAYDKGINYFDTAEGYTEGLSERLIGEVLPHTDRKKIFITTKLKIDEDETKEKIIERFNKCLERLKTEYVDALFNHMPPKVSYINHPGFFAAVNELKAEGKVKFVGISSHGPRGDKDDSMEDILCQAAESGKYDIVLFAYNFLNFEAGDKIIAACKKHNVGAKAMKTLTGMINVPVYNPDHPTEDQQQYLDRILKRGTSKEKAIKRLEKNIERQKKSFEKSQPFVKKNGINTKEQLHKACVQFAISNQDINTTLVSLRSFDLVDMALELSGTKLSEANRHFLNDYKYAYNDMYCRHACNQCSSGCPNNVPVSTIMRYAYYYETHGIEKYAMQKYNNMIKKNGLVCESCNAPCVNYCPYGLDIQGQLLQAHEMLTFV